MKINKKTEGLMYRKVEKVLEKFGRIRISYPDYGKSETTWNGIYAEIEPPQDYKKALMELIIFGMKLKKP